MSELSREQVEYECKWLTEEHCTSLASKWLSTDAALRARLAEVEKDCVKYGPICLVCGRIGSQPCMTEDEANKHGASTPCTFDPSPKAIWEENKRLKARVAAVEREVEKKQALLLRSCQDNIEDYNVQCKPTCDDYGHADDCPSAHPGLVYDELRRQLAALALTWTRDAPKAEGQWWYRESAGDGWFTRIYLVYELTTGKCSISDEHGTTPVEYMTGEWAGPIQLPKAG